MTHLLAVEAGDDRPLVLLRVVEQPLGPVLGAGGQPPAEAALALVPIPVVEAAGVVLHPVVAAADLAVVDVPGRVLPVHAEGPEEVVAADRRRAGALVAAPAGHEAAVPDPAVGGSHRLLEASVAEHPPGDPRVVAVRAVDRDHLGGVVAQAYV